MAVIGKISITELDQYRRLVDFAKDVNDHAFERDDTDLQEMVRTLLFDLLEMHDGG